MDPGFIPSLIGMVLASLVLPMLLFVPLALIPATKSRHKLRYVTSGALAMAMPWLMVTNGAPALRASVATILLGALFYWSYRRAVSPGAFARASK